MIEGIASHASVHGLFGFHGCLHHLVVCDQGLRVVFGALEDIRLDTLAQTVLGHGGNNFSTVIFLGHDPTNHLIEREQITGSGSMQVLALHHGFANGGRVLFQFLHHGRIVKNSTGNLAVSSSQTQDQMKRGFFLNVVITQSASIFQLFASKNEALLIRWNAFLVLNLLFDIVDGVTGFDVQRNRFSSQSFDKDLWVETTYMCERELENSFVFVNRNVALLLLLIDEYNTSLVSTHLAMDTLLLAQSNQRQYYYLL